MGNGMGAEVNGIGVRGGSGGGYGRRSKKEGGGAELESMGEEKGRGRRGNDTGKEKEAG